jgi:hypothetical protein
MRLILSILKWSLEIFFVSSKIIFQIVKNHLFILDFFQIVEEFVYNIMSTKKIRLNACIILIRKRGRG